MDQGVTIYRTLVRADQRCGWCQDECFELLSRHVLPDGGEFWCTALVCPRCDLIRKAIT